MAGVEDGQTVRMPVGSKELFITFRVDGSDYFKRDGPDVHTEAEITLAQAVLGGTIRIQGIYEDHTVQVHLTLIDRSENYLLQPYNFNTHRLPN